MGHAPEIVEMIDTKGWRVAEEPVTILYTEYSMAKGQSLLNGVNIVFDRPFAGTGADPGAGTAEGSGMTIIKILLILAVVALLLVLLRSHGTNKGGAYVKIGMAVFLAFAAYAVIRPDDVTWVAAQLGVGRGIDLVLYMLVLGFGFFAISTYLRFKEMELKSPGSRGRSPWPRRSGVPNGGCPTTRRPCSTSWRASRRRAWRSGRSRRVPPTAAPRHSARTVPKVVDGECDPRPRSTRGRHPSSTAASVESRAESRRSPSRAGATSGSSAAPAARATSVRSSRSVVRTPVPML